MGAWIETLAIVPNAAFIWVAPRVGAWIETKGDFALFGYGVSHPVWVRGLKQKMLQNFEHLKAVAPRVGAWIETLMNHELKIHIYSRTPCGCVD